MSASAELRALLDEVAAGKVHPEKATAAIARWMVLTAGAIHKVPVEDLMRQAARHAREESARICDAYLDEVHDFDSNIDAARTLADRIRMRGDTLDRLPSPRQGDEKP